MTSRRITELVFREDSYEVTAEGNRSASISPTSGLINIEPGDNSTPDWCLVPDNVIGFESSPNADGEGRSILLAFQTDAGERHRLYLGTTIDTGAAESWVSRVNALYPQSHSLDHAGNVAIARQAPPSGTPFIDELIEAGKVIFMPGIYGNMIPRNGSYSRPKPYEPEWLTSYARRVLENAQQVTGCKRGLRFEQAIPPGLDTGALTFTLDLVRPFSLRERRPDNSPRAVLWGELLFESLHRPQVRVLALSEATHLALVIRDGSRFQKSLSKARGSLSVNEKDASLTDWLEALLRSRKADRMIPIVTLDREVADLHLMDTLINLGKDEAQVLSRFSAGSIEMMAELLHTFETDEAVAVCESGIANELTRYYASRYRNVRRGFLKIQPRYDQPVKVGLGVPIEDPVWGEICAESLRQTIYEGSKTEKDSLEKTRKRVERSLGMQWAVAA